jgi:hypothetical protein
MLKKINRGLCLPIQRALSSPSASQKSKHFFDESLALTLISKNDFSTHFQGIISDRYSGKEG